MQRNKDYEATFRQIRHAVAATVDESLRHRQNTLALISVCHGDRRVAMTLAATGERQLHMPRK